MSNFPSTLTSYTNPQPTDRLNAPSHSAVEIAQNSGLSQLEDVIGVEGPASVVGTFQYLVKSPASDGGGHVQSANKGGTGQTAYAKGDILVAQSSSVLSKLSIGADGAVITADSTQPVGIKWGAVPGISISSTLATSSVWSKPAAVSANARVFVELWGGGGSGAAGHTTSEMGGGGGGGYASGWYLASLLPASVLVSAGAGGAGVATGNTGLQGSNSVFDPTTSMLVGYGGGAGDTTTTGGGGGGGGGIRAKGNNANGAAGGVAGGNTFYSSVFGGDGGTGQASVLNAFYGGGGAGILSFNQPGTAGNAIYGGGGGGCSGSSVFSNAGGISTFGGNGSAGSFIGASSNSILGGSIPGGGGGAMYGEGVSGAGGNGLVRITTFL